VSECVLMCSWCACCRVSDSVILCSFCAYLKDLNESYSVDGVHIAESLIMLFVLDLCIL
jgi:hypothetical protein